MRQNDDDGNGNGDDDETTMTIKAETIQVIECKQTVSYRISHSLYVLNLLSLSPDRQRHGCLRSIQMLLEIQFFQIQTKRMLYQCLWLVHGIYRETERRYHGHTCKNQIYFAAFTGIMNTTTNFI